MKMTELLPLKVYPFTLIDSMARRTDIATFSSVLSNAAALPEGTQQWINIESTLFQRHHIWMPKIAFFL